MKSEELTTLYGTLKGLPVEVILTKESLKGVWESFQINSRTNQGRMILAVDGLLMTIPATSIREIKPMTETSTNPNSIK